MKLLYLTGKNIYKDKLREVNNTFRAEAFAQLDDVYIGGWDCDEFGPKESSRPIRVDDYVKWLWSQGVEITHVFLADPWHNFWDSCPDYPNCPPLYEGIDELNEMPIGLVVESGDSQFYYDETVGHLRKNPRSAVAIRSKAHEWRFLEERLRGHPIFYLPHGAYPEMVLAPVGVEKDTDILFSGSFYPDSYPLRARVHTALSTAEGKSLNVDYLSHPSDAPPGVIGPDFWKRIARAKLAVAGTNIYGCLTMRYLEIPASGTLAVGDLPDEAKDLAPYMLVIEPTDDPFAILRKIKAALNDPALPTRTKAAMNHVLREKMFDRYARELVEACRIL